MVLQHFLFSINSDLSIGLGSNGTWWKMYQNNVVYHIFYSFHNLFAAIYKTKAYNRRTKWHMFRSIQLFISNYEFQMWKMNQTYHATLCFTMPCYACQFDKFMNTLFSICGPIDSSHSSISLFGYDICISFARFTPIERYKCMHTWISGIE